MFINFYGVVDFYVKKIVLNRELILQFLNILIFCFMNDVFVYFYVEYLDIGIL